MAAGLNYYDDRNKVESTLLQTQYLAEVVGYIGSVPQYKYTRIRTKNYSYVGLDKETAKRCVTEKLDQYTRTFWNWYQDYTGRWMQDKSTKGRYQECVAGINAQKQGGSLWAVQIQVNEVAIAYLYGQSVDLEQTFKYYLGEWSYDE